MANPGVVFSAGGVTNNLTAVTFSNGNGVTFGLNAGVITASASGGGGGGSINISAGTTSSNVSRVTFSNANGVTFGFDGSNVSASVQTNYAGTGFTSTTTAGTAIVGTLNSNGVSLGVPAFLTTSPAVTNSSWTVSDSATSATVGRLAFVNSNGVTFGLSTSNNGQQSISASYSVPTVTNSSWTVSDSATSATVGRLAFVNSNGVSFALSTSNNGQQTIKASIATTYAGTGFTSTTTAGTAIVGTLNTSGLSLGVPAYLTTAMQSNAATISNINVSAGSTSTNASAFTFSNSNGVTFGLGTGASAGVVTASVAGASAGIGGISNSQTMYTSGTVAVSEGGGAITIASSTAGGGGQSFMFSVPQTSSLVGTSGISVSTNGSTISIYAATSYLTNIKISAGTASNNLSAVTFSNSNGVSFGLNGSTITGSVAFPVSFYEPYGMTNTALLGPTAGSWYLAPFIAPGVISGGRVNLLHQNTSTASLFRDITGASFASGSTGNLAQSFTYSKAVALWSQGSGTNSTRLESVWSNSFSFGWSKSIGVALSQASNINISVQHSISYISEIGSDGAYTLNQYANSTASTVANSSTASNNFDTVFSSGRNLVSGSIVEPIGFNTTITQGAYWLGFAWSTTRATASTGGGLGSALDFSVSSEVGISRLLLEASYRNWGSTNTTARSHIMPYGVYTGAANMAPPQFIALSSDLSSLGSAWIAYFNFQYQGITK